MKFIQMFISPWIFSGGLVDYSALKKHQVEIPNDGLKDFGVSWHATVSDVIVRLMAFHAVAGR